MPRLFCAISRCALTLIGSGALWADDPLIGTWKLNLGESKFTSMPVPKSTTRRYAPHPDGIEVTTTTVPQKGPPTTFGYVVNPDGEEHPVTGNPNVDFFVLRRVDAFTAEGTLFSYGKVRGTVLRIISPDGRTMSIALQWTDYKGKIFQQTTVFNKEKP